MAVLSALSPLSTTVWRWPTYGDGSKHNAVASCHQLIDLASSTRISKLSPSLCAQSADLSTLGSNMPDASHSFHLFRNSSCYKWMLVDAGLFHYHQSGGSRWRLKPVYSLFPTTPAQVSAVQDLFDFICSGPLFDKLGMTPESWPSTLINGWLMACTSVGCFNSMSSTSQFPKRPGCITTIFPSSCGVKIRFLSTTPSSRRGKIFHLLCAPQGCGKTTLVFALNYLFKVTGRKCATEENPANALLELRGNAGTHDLQFSVETLTAVTNLTKEGMKMKLPRYDKSAYNGKGDRADPSTWPEVEGPLTAVLFEGWMLGFKPLPADVVKAVDPQLETVNKNLEAYYDAWDKFVKAWIVIEIQDPSCVYQWRLQAEIAMREAGSPGMSDEEVRDFVSRYLPAYKAYLPTLYSEGPNGSDPEHLLVIEIDEGRNPL
ncbi:uncharacterized protein J3R85_013497 [Psidium guajava]|nr:uncharacterized protein J3R85_013497 [Psidium guajava]